MFKFIRRNNTQLIKIVNQKNYPLRLLFLIISCFIFAFNYNVFLAPNNIVVGGMTGLAIIIKQLTGISTSYFIYASTVILTIVFYITFGKEKTINTIIGSIVFMIMVTLTEPMAKSINITFSSKLIMIILAAFLQGISNGMIYRGGFNTGGSDIIATLFVKFFKISTGSALKIINTIIIAAGALVFGFTNAIYAIIILLISSKLVDIVMLGINDSKMCFIRSNKWKEIENKLNFELNLGVTEMGNLGGLFIKKDPILLVIVPYHTYLELKEKILQIDETAFITSYDCYMALGGYKKTILPF